MAGAVLVLIGGYFEFRGDPSAADQGSSQPLAAASPAPSKASGSPAATAGTPTAVPPKTSMSPAKPKATSTRKSAASGSPIRVSVPRLGVSARILPIRVRKGALIPPSNPRLVGWWSAGARPGAAKGSAIITGHTVHTGGGAFDDLDQLKAGDAVKVTTGKGSIAYTVVGVKVYRKKTLANEAARLFDQTVPGRLVLVTCEDWDGTAYLSNAVVIAQPVA